ncbi:MAG: diphthine synthase [Candidatus Nanohaloarchaea archaeon]
MLRIIGLGLDSGELTRKAEKALKDAEKVYAEFYTNTETVDLEELEQRLDLSIEKLERSQVERDDLILESSAERDTAFLVSGDPLTATTHYDIKHRAEHQGIETEVHHAPSIITSVNETGLNIYRFGRIVTLPADGRPESLIEHVEANDSIGLHTLVLLDINYSADAAAAKLLEMGVDNREAVVVERANSEDMKVTVSDLGEVAGSDLGEPPHSIVLTGEKSHMEEEFLEGHR